VLEHGTAGPLDSLHRKRLAVRLVGASWALALPVWLVWAWFYGNAHPPLDPSKTDEEVSVAVIGWWGGLVMMSRLVAWVTGDAGLPRPLVSWLRGKERRNRDYCLAAIDRIAPLGPGAALAQLARIAMLGHALVWLVGLFGGNFVSHLTEQYPLSLGVRQFLILSLFGATIWGLLLVVWLFRGLSERRGVEAPRAPGGAPRMGDG